jgi:hypothetical protein
LKLGLELLSFEAIGSETGATTDSHVHSSRFRFSRKTARRQRVHSLWWRNLMRVHRCVSQSFFDSNQRACFLPLRLKLSNAHGALNIAFSHSLSAAHPPALAEGFLLAAASPFSGKASRLSWYSRAAYYKSCALTKDYIQQFARTSWTAFEELNFLLPTKV